MGFGYAQMMALSMVCSTVSVTMRKLCIENFSFSRVISIYMGSQGVVVAEKFFLSKTGERFLSLF